MWKFVMQVDRGKGKDKRQWVRVSILLSSRGYKDRRERREEGKAGLK